MTIHPSLLAAVTALAATPALADEPVLSEAAPAQATSAIEVAAAVAVAVPVAAVQPITSWWLTRPTPTPDLTEAEPVEVDLREISADYCPPCGRG